MMMAWMSNGGPDAYLASMAVRGVALLVLAGGAALLLRKRSAAARYQVWLLGLVGLLGLPVVGLVGPRWSVELPSGFPAFGPGVAAMSGDMEVPDIPTRSGEGTANPASFPRPAHGVTPDEDVGVRPGREEVARRSVGASGSRGSARPSGRETLPGWGLLLALWMAGTVGLLVRLVGSHVALRRVQGQARACTEGPLVARCRLLAGRVGVHRRIRLLLGRPDAMPMSWGTLRPCILLPSGASSWPASRVDAVLLHELAHVRRRDCLAQLLAELAVALHWYNPMAWLAARRLRVEREHACDDDVLRQGTRATQYASELVALARELRLSAVAAPTAVAILGPADLKTRVRAVLDRGRTRSFSRRLSGAGACLAAAVVMALATVTPARARPALPGAPEADPPSISLTAPSSPSAVDASDPPPTFHRVAVLQQSMSCGMANEGWKRSSVSSEDDLHHVLQWSRPGCAVEVRIEGDVDFTDDFRGIARLARGAYVRLEETEGRTQRWLEVTAGPGGEPVFEYRVDGQDRPFDQEARAWYAAMTLQALRRSGLKAEERVASMLRAGGVPAVLAELELLAADHVFAAYVEELIRQSDISEEQAVQLVERARTRIDSDHYMAGILVALVDRHLTSPRGVDAFLRAATTLESDHYRAQVLGHALEHRTITQPQVAALIDAVAGMESDHYVAEVLLSVAERYFLDEGMRATYLRAVRGVESDHYRAEILGALLDRNDLGDSELSDVLSAVGEMESDHYQTELLKRFASDGISAGETERYLAVVAGMESDHYQSEALQHLSLMELSDAQLERVIGAVARMDSDHYKAALLVELADQDRVRKGTLYDAMVDAMNTIDSTHSRGQVAESLLRR